MAAARFSSDVLQNFYGPIMREANRNLPQPMQQQQVVSYHDGFLLPKLIFENGFVFGEWLYTKEMFPRITKAKFTDSFESEIQS